MTEFLNSEIPWDVLFKIALHLKGTDLRNFCRSNKKASRICSDPYFRNAWSKYHDHLTFEQRQAIDISIDDAVDKSIDLLIEETDYEYPTYADFLKENIREDFRTKIGRDMRIYILKHPPLDIIQKYTIISILTNKLATILMDYLPHGMEGSMSDYFFDVVYYTIKDIIKINGYNIDFDR